jgi:DNA-binding NtrC family response regulator
LLANHFIEKYSKNAGRKVCKISRKAMKQLVAYSWPGNVRELEHSLERSVLLTEGEVIREMHLPADKSNEIKSALEDEYVKTFEENERDHIIDVLNKCNGKIFGAGGAAELLNINVNTLNSKIKKLGIQKGRVFFRRPI